MNREIKFRVWDKVNKCIRDVWSITWDFTPAIPTQIVACNPVINNEYVLTANQFELMQYTGLTDKNGKEIYEGDIIIIEDEYTEPILDDGSGPREVFNHLAPVVFTDGSFGVEIKERGDIFNKGFISFDKINYYIGETEFEGIGNIYEHPELTKDV